MDDGRGWIEPRYRSELGIEVEHHVELWGHPQLLREHQEPKRDGRRHVLGAAASGPALDHRTRRQPVRRTRWWSVGPMSHENRTPAKPRGRELPPRRP